MVNNKNVIAIDLDDTMLNTKEIYNDLIRKELYGFGITEEMFWLASEKEAKSRSNEGMYSLKSHLEILIKDNCINLINAEKLKFIIADFTSRNSGKYLFTDVVDFLDSYYRQSDLVILTRGPIDLQSWKIKGLQKYIDVKKYFSNITITHRDKGEVMDEICNEKNRLNVFIDDSLIQINSVAKARPDVVTIWMARKTKRINIEKAMEGRVDYDYKVSGLKEADSILGEIV